MKAWQPGGWANRHLDASGKANEVHKEDSKQSSLPRNLQSSLVLDKTEVLSLNHVKIGTSCFCNSTGSRWHNWS